MTNFYERQLKRMFGDSEVLSADTVFAGKAMVSKISDDLRAKIEFVTARVSGQYEGLKLSIINKNEGLIDSQTFMFHEIIGLKGTARDRKPHVWDDNGKSPIHHSVIFGNKRSVKKESRAPHILTSRYWRAVFTAVNRIGNYVRYYIKLT